MVEGEDEETVAKINDTLTQVPADGERVSEDRERSGRQNAEATRRMMAMMATGKLVS